MATETPYQTFKQVFEDHYNALCNYAHSFLADAQSCEDVVQEVFVRIWEKRQDLVQSDSIRFYLYASVRNNCLTQIETGRKAPVVELKDYGIAGSEEAVAAHGDDTIDYRAHLAKAISMLPEKCREVFLLSRMSKQSYKEIADGLGISVKTVENQIGKALKVLRAYAREHKLLLVVLLMMIKYLK